MLSENVTVKIFAAGIIFRDFSPDDKVLKHAEAALCAFTENKIFSLLTSEANLCIHYKTVEFALRFEADMANFSWAVPI